MILAVVSDLFFDAKITATARVVGVEVVAVRTIDAAAARLADAGAAVTGLIVDLSLPGGDPIGFVRAVKASTPGVRVVAFLPHVEADRRRAAKEAGADEVLPRSKFSEALAAILGRLGDLAQ
ncbi:MAG: response regulator transcription factor [Phycisphaerales bacterium]|nr:response regulator transcription factor [Phycisphaerales bacterium]